MSRSGARGCLKTGMFGCLGCSVVVVGVAFVVAGVGLALGVPDPELVQREWSRQLPPGAVAAPPAGPEALDSSELGAGDELPPARPGGARPPAGRVVLDLSVGEFSIEPGPPGQPIRVEADYDEASYELVERLEQDDQGWVYRIEFGSTISWTRRMFRPGEIHNKVRIVLPRDLPFSLEGKIGIGESRTELGGLWLTDVDLDTGVGEHTLAFGEPLPEPIERFRLRGSTGELTVRGLGNASPAEVWAHQNVGEFRLDLTGNWKRDAEVKANLRIGELQIRVPGEGVGVETARASISIGERNLDALQRREPLPAGAPTLRLSLSQFIGEMTAQR